MEVAYVCRAEAVNVGGAGGGVGMKGGRVSRLLVGGGGDLYLVSQRSRMNIYC